MYRGIAIELPVADGGYNANQNVSRIKPGELIQADNVTYQFGNLQKEGGSNLYTPSPLAGAPTIWGGWDFWPAGSTQRSVIWAGTTILKDSGAGSYSTSLATGLNQATQPPVFVEGGKEQAANNKKLFIFTGNNKVQVLSGDGTSTTNIAGPAVDWNSGQPSCGCLHDNRLWASGGSSDPFRLYYSRFGNHEDFIGSWNITGAANNGSGAIRLTLSTPTGWTAATATQATGDQLTVSGVNGTTEANGTWLITVVDGTHIDLQGSTFTNAYTSGGVAKYVDTGGTILLYPGQGTSNAMMTSFKKQLIVLRFPKGIYNVDTTDPLITNWVTNQITRELGIGGPGAWAYLDDNIMFMDASWKFHVLSDVREYGDFGLRAIGDDKYIHSFIDNNIDQSKFALVNAILYAHKREIHWAMPKLGSATNNIRLVLDMNMVGAMRWRYSDKDALQSLWLIRESSDGIPTPMGGDAAGQVWLLDQANKSVNNVGYPTIFQTAHYDMDWLGIPNLSARRKLWDFLECVVETEGNWNLAIDVYLDGQYRQTVLFNMGSQGAALGSFTLDHDVLASGAVLAKRRRLTGSSRRISFWGYINGANQDFSLAKLIIHFRRGDERASSS